MFFWIYDYPTQFIGALFAIVSVALTWCGILLLRPILRNTIHAEPRANDMVGFTLSSFSVLYGLLVGLLAVASYQNFSTVNDLVTKEGSSLGALYRDLGGLPEPARGNLRDELRAYTQSVVDVSWPRQQQGLLPAEEAKLIGSFTDDLVTFDPTQKGQEIVYAQCLQQLNILLTIRRERLSNVTTGIPAVLWWVVGVGALLNLILVMMLSMELRLHLILGGFLSLFLGIVIFLIAAMDNPFRGEVSVGADPIRAVLEAVMTKSASASVK